LGELLGLGNHAVNILLSETSLLVGDSDRLDFTGTLVGGGDLHDTVGVNLERNLDLGNTAWSGRNAGELELAKEIVVLGEGAFTLEDLDQDSGLVVGGGGEDLALASRDDGITGDELGQDTTGGLDTEGEGINVSEDDIAQALIASEDSTLNGSTIGDSLIGVDTFGRHLSEVLLEELLELVDTSRATDENNLQDMLVEVARTAFVELRCRCVDATAHQFHVTNIKIMQLQDNSFEDLSWHPSEVGSRWHSRPQFGPMLAWYTLE